MEGVTEVVHAKLEPYIKRTKELEDRIEVKDNELMLLRHAVANLQRIVEEAKKNPKK
jgi:glycerol-3-phosphate responsive antiterminator